MVTPEEMDGVRRAVEQFKVMRSEVISHIGGTAEAMTGELTILLPLAPDKIGLSPRVNELIGEIMTTFALAENGLHQLLPDDPKYHRKCKREPVFAPEAFLPWQHYPSIGEDVINVRQIICDERLKGDVRQVLQRITGLVEQLRPDRNNLGHGQILLLSAFSVTLPAAKQPRAIPAPRPRMVRRNERNGTVLAEDILAPIAGQCRELVSLIARQIRTYGGISLPSPPGKGHGG